MSHRSSVKKRSFDVSARSFDDTFESAARRLFDVAAGASEAEIESCIERLSRSGTWFDAPRARWLVTSNRDAHSVLTNKALSNNLKLACPHTKSANLAERIDEETLPLLFTDPPLHSRLREVMSAVFSAMRTKTMARSIGGRADRLTSKCRKLESFDLATDLAQPFALGVALESFGFPEGDGKTIADLVDDLFDVNHLFDLTARAEVIERAKIAAARIRVFVSRHLHTSSAITAAVARLKMPTDDVVPSIEFALRAGVVTTSCLIVRVLAKALAERNSQSIVDFEQLIPSSSPALEAGRVTTEPLQLGDVLIPAGQTVICLLPSSTQDLLARGEDSRTHLTFGAGRHRCIGEDLVKEEIRAIGAAWRSERGHLKLLGTPEFHRSPSFYGVRRLRVRWIAEVGN